MYILPVPGGRYTVTFMPDVLDASSTEAPKPPGAPGYV